MKVINGHVIHSQGSALAVWRSSIGLTAKMHEVKKIEGPVRISLDFYLSKGHTVKRLLPTVPPDLDKLIRAVLDALTGIAYHDDAQVVELVTTKKYGAEPGVDISISPVRHVGEMQL
jgi:Holliday junction resolvase RusA-like endonuclease